MLEIDPKDAYVSLGGCFKYFVLFLLALVIIVAFASMF